MTRTASDCVSLQRNKVVRSHNWLISPYPTADTTAPLAIGLGVRKYLNPQLQLTGIVKSMRPGGSIFRTGSF